MPNGRKGKRGGRVIDFLAIGRVGPIGTDPCSASVSIINFVRFRFLSLHALLYHHIYTYLHMHLYLLTIPFTIFDVVVFGWFGLILSLLCS